MGLEYCSPWLVWIFPIVSSLFVPLAAKMGSRVRDSFVILAGALTLVLAISLIPSAYSSAPESHMSVRWIPIANVELGVLLDPLSVLFTNLVAFIGLVVLIYSLSYMAHEEGLTRYYFLMLLFIGSMIGLVIADNFLQLFMFWELVGLCSYALVSFWYARPEAVKAGMKVFLMTKVGDIALLAGILLLYADLHVLSYSEVFEKSATIAMPALTAISLLMLFGAIAKSAQLPLHTWLYSAMEAPTSVSCLLHGATMVKGGVYLISRTHVMFSGIPVWLSSVAWIGAITALIGAVLALHTPDIKGVPAYSTTSQIGFMIAPFGVASSTEALGWFAGLFHMVSHAFFQGLGFLAIGSIVHQLGTRDMRKMGGLRKEMPFTFALCLIVILARSGIPPFCGFFSKGLVASSLLSSGNTVLILLIYSAAAVTFAYSCRFLLITFTGEKSRYAKEIEVHEASRLMSFSSSILAAGCVIFGFLGGPLAGFLRAGFVFDFSDFFGLESLIFVGTLLVGGLPVYLIYKRGVMPPERFREGRLALLDNLLERGFYFDSAYVGIAKGLMRLSRIHHKAIEARLMTRVPYLVASGISRFVQGIHRIVEINILERIPDLVARGITRFAYGFHRVVELNELESVPGLIAVGSMKLANAALRRFDNALDKLAYTTASATASHSVRIRRFHSGSLPHFVLAAITGFIFLCCLLLLTL
ncbi:MAG: NADH-quinone oxidoreductase subunit L [Candidatus Bathyarchaeota archaeon]|nr:NADH-quinone oxidoreductase subunit L [Candidatus Bathyarchaeota archaeon]